LSFVNVVKTNISKIYATNMTKTILMAVLGNKCHDISHTRPQWLYINVNVNIDEIKSTNNLTEEKRLVKRVCVPSQCSGLQ